MIHSESLTDCSLMISMFYKYKVYGEVPCHIISYEIDLGYNEQYLEAVVVCR